MPKTIILLTSGAGFARSAMAALAQLDRVTLDSIPLIHPTGEPVCSGDLAPGKRITVQDIGNAYVRCDYVPKRERRKDWLKRTKGYSK